MGTPQIASRPALAKETSRLLAKTKRELPATARDPSAEPNPALLREPPRRPCLSWALARASPSPPSEARTGGCDSFFRACARRQPHAPRRRGAGAPRPVQSIHERRRTRRRPLEITPRAAPVGSGGCSAARVSLGVPRSGPVEAPGALPRSAPPSKRKRRATARARAGSDARADVARTHPRAPLAGHFPRGMSERWPSRRDVPLHANKQPAGPTPPAHAWPLAEHEEEDESEKTKARQPRQQQQARREGEEERARAQREERSARVSPRAH